MTLTQPNGFVRMLAAISAVGTCVIETLLSLYLITKPEEAQVQALHASMVLRIASNLNGRLVVHQHHRRRRKLKTKLRQELAKPERLLACSDSSNELSLSSQQRNDGLKLRKPGNSARDHANNVGRRGLARVRIATVISIRIHRKQLQRFGVRRVGQSMVKRPFDVSEQVLNSTSVSHARISHEATEHTNSVSNVRTSGDS
jgi:hypothetical protein